MEGHEFLGLGFLIVGLWHLFNQIKLNATCSKSFKSTLWFPTTTRFKYLELHFIIACCTIFIATELFISPTHHNPLDPHDGTIPYNHLHNFEHSLMAFSFLLYAAFAIFLDAKKSAINNNYYEITHLLGAIAFSQEFLLLHLHSRDHMGPEGQYHYLLQILIAISVATTLMAIRVPESFMVSFVRSLSIIFQGVWLMVMGFMLWTPGYQAKGCSLRRGDGEGDSEGGGGSSNHYVVKCDDEKALHRAVALVNIQFSWLLILVTVFAMSFYLILGRIYGGGKVEYVSLRKEEEGSDNDLESQSMKKCMQEKI